MTRLYRSSNSIFASFASFVVPIPRVAEVPTRLSGEKDKLPGPPARPSCRAKPGWRPRSASADCQAPLAAPSKRQPEGHARIRPQNTKARPIAARRQHFTFHRIGSAEILIGLSLSAPGNPIRSVPLTTIAAPAGARNHWASSLGRTPTERLTTPKRKSPPPISRSRKGRRPWDAAATS